VTPGLACSHCQGTHRAPAGIGRAAGALGAAQHGNCHSLQPCKALAAPWRCPCPPGLRQWGCSTHPPTHAPAGQGARLQHRRSPGITQVGAGCSDPPHLPLVTGMLGSGLGVSADPPAVTRGRGGRAAVVAAPSPPPSPAAPERWPRAGEQRAGQRRAPQDGRQPGRRAGRMAGRNAGSGAGRQAAEQAALQDSRQRCRQ